MAATFAAATGAAAAEMAAPAAGGPNLDAILSIPLSRFRSSSARPSMPVAKLMKLCRGAVITLDQKWVGAPVHVLVNGRLVARGEVVVLDDDSLALRRDADRDRQTRPTKGRLPPFPREQKKPH